jgi:hypothetical protein
MKNLVRMLLLGLAGLAAIVSAGDQATSPPPPAPAPPAAAAPTPAGDIEDFVPSEKVSADDAVSFPVDI